MDRYSIELQYTHSTGYTITGRGRPLQRQREIVDGQRGRQQAPVGRLHRFVLPNQELQQSDPRPSAELVGVPYLQSKAERDPIAKCFCE